MPRNREPAWWYLDASDWRARALSPVAQVYGSIASSRIRRSHPVSVGLPVICVGNFVAGGTGKTPLSLAVAAIVRELGYEPWFLSRGYGGSLVGPVRVDPELHTASDVGDEPLLLAQSGPATVSRNRADGAALIARSAPRNAVIIMDDGLQNPQLVKDLRIAVVDAARGLGNGCVIPAGPLRAPMALQATLVDCVIVNGAKPGMSKAEADLSGVYAGPLLCSRTAVAGNTTDVRGQRVIAFAGIANPNRFFDLLQTLGAIIVARVPFADHQPYSEAAARDLLDRARASGARLITTEKDLARLANRTGVIAELRAACSILPIETIFEDDGRARLSEMVASAIARKHDR